MVDKKMSKYYWILGVGAVTLLIFILSLIFIIIPSFKSIGKVNQDLKENQAELKVAEDKLAKLRDLKVKEDELKEQSRIVYRAIPTKKEVGDIFIQLKGLATEVGGTTKGDKSSSSSSSGSSTATTNPSVITGVSTLNYDSNVTFPDYNSFKTLLDNSEKALRYVHLDSFKINVKDTFTADLSYTAYYRSDESQSESTKAVGGGQ